MTIKENLLTVNPFSRSGRTLFGVRYIVMHWVANPKTSAQMNRNFFENRKLGKTGYGSAHYIIDPTEVIRCIPENEVAYHVGAEHYMPWAIQHISNYPNSWTLGIELCHEDWEGNFHPDTMIQAIELVGELCEKYKLTKDNIIRHYDVTGKDCPHLFVQHPEEFEAFKNLISIGG
jgi:N-acetylmuramoyl-L-alanine amidase